MIFTPSAPTVSNSVTAAPIFPPMAQTSPACSRIWPIRAVVVDLPFVPVMDTQRPLRPRLRANSTSLKIGMPASMHAFAAGWGSG